MASLNDLLKNGLPELLDNVGGLADDVRGIAGTVTSTLDTIKNRGGSDVRNEAVAPVNTQVEPKDVQGPDLAKSETNRTLLIAGGVAVGLLALGLVLRR